MDGGTLVLVDYTAADIRRISELGRDPSNWRPGGREAREQARRMAAAIADAYTDDDWSYVLNALSPSRAAHQIASRPPEDRDHLLGLLDLNRRVDVEFLPAAVA